MRCLNDNNIIEEDNIELPMLKDSKVFENINKENIIEQDNVKIEETAFGSEENVKYRKRLLKKAVIFSLIIIGLFVVVIFIFRSNNNLGNINNVFDVTQVNKVLNSYKNTKEKNEILELLDSVKNDDEDKKKVQTEAYEVFNYWLDNLDENNYSNYDEFYNEIEGYRNLLNSVYRQFVYSAGDIEVKMLDEESYSTLENMIENIKLMGEKYYAGLDLYKENDYNEAYEKFTCISNDSIFYEKANSYKIEIENIIMSLIEKDVENLGNNMDFLDEEQKRERYLQIVEVISVYNDVYDKINLDENSRYIEMYNKYNSYVR